MLLIVNSEQEEGPASSKLISSTQHRGEQLVSVEGQCWMGPNLFKSLAAFYNPSSESTQRLPGGLDESWGPSSGQLVSLEPVHALSAGASGPVHRESP